MTHDVFDVYATIIKDTSELSARRRELDGQYITLITFILTGDAYVAFISAFTNWLQVAITIGISFVGWVIISRWRNGMLTLEKTLSHRYEYLRKLEATDLLQQLGATQYTEEYQLIYEHGYKRLMRKLTGRLQDTFLVVFLVIPLLLIALTAIDTIPIIHQMIPSQALPYLRPLSAPLKP